MFKVFGKSSLKDAVRRSNLRAMNYFFGGRNANQKTIGDQEVKTEDYFDNGSQLKYIQTYRGKFPYMPLDDHPLIPGYARQISISKKYLEILKATNAEAGGLVVSVVKNRNTIEAMQSTS